MRDGAHNPFAATNATGASVCRQPSPAFARDFTNRHRLAHLGRCLPSWWRRSRRWCRIPLFALRSTTAAQATAALQTDPPAASRGSPPQSVNGVSGLSRTATRGPVGLPRGGCETASGFFVVHHRPIASSRLGSRLRVSSWFTIVPSRHRVFLVTGAGRKRYPIGGSAVHMALACSEHDNRTTDSALRILRRLRLDGGTVGRPDPRRRPPGERARLHT